jgi:phage baseplate assembly protein W
MPYKSLVLTNANAAYQQPIKQRSQLYKGFSSLNEDNPSSQLFDLDLIKQDILNHFNTRKGSRVMKPEFGSLVWDILMEPLTQTVREALVADVKRICTSDPRVTPTQMDITEYPNGFILELTLVLNASNQSANMKIDFNQSIGLATSS